LTSRAFHNDQLGVFEEYVTKYFGFDNYQWIGAEAVETALKLQENGATKSKVFLKIRLKWLYVKITW
jgi:ornithine--oxo-acid transaminase